MSVSSQIMAVVTDARTRLASLEPLIQSCLELVFVAKDRPIVAQFLNQEGINGEVSHSSEQLEGCPIDLLPHENTSQPPLLAHHHSVAGPPLHLHHHPSLPFQLLDINTIAVLNSASATLLLYINIILCR